MNGESIKEAFQRVKDDIFALGTEVNTLRQEIFEVKSELKLVSSVLEDMRIAQMENPTHIPTHASENYVKFQSPTDNPTLPCEIGGLIQPKTAISTGNCGVPTDKPTDRQTNQQTVQHIDLPSIKPETVSFDKASEILANLDSLKKEVRFKFKKLTPQEMQVFSSLYLLEDTGEFVDYKILSSKLSLSESSIRDYIGKIQKKGIPILKEKLNNKRIILHISQDLKKIASLSTILKLRDI